MSLIKNKVAAEKWLLNQCGQNIVQKSAIVIVRDEQVLKVSSEKDAKELSIRNQCDAFKLLYRNNQVETSILSVDNLTISDLLDRTTKADLARARGKSQVHSSTQYPAFIAKIEDIETACKKLGYRVVLVPL